MYHWFGLGREDWEGKFGFLHVKWNLGFVHLGNGEIQAVPSKYLGVIRNAWGCSTGEPQLLTEPPVPQGHPQAQPPHKQVLLICVQRGDCAEGSAWSELTCAWCQGTTSTKELSMYTPGSGSWGRVRVTRVLAEGEAVPICGACWKRSSGGRGGCLPLADPTVCSACSPLAALTTPCSPSWAASTAGPWVSCPLSPLTPQLTLLVLTHTVPVQKL